MANLRAAVLADGDEVGFSAVVRNGLLHPLPPAGTGRRLRPATATAHWGSLDPPSDVPLWITGEWRDGAVQVLSTNRTDAPSWFDLRHSEPTAGSAMPAARSSTERRLFDSGVLLWLGPSPTAGLLGTVLASVSNGSASAVRVELTPRYGDQLAIMENPWTARDLAAADETIPESALVATSGGLDAQGRMRRRALFEVATAEAIEWQESFPVGMVDATAWIAPGLPTSPGAYSGATSPSSSP